MRLGILGVGNMGEAILRGVITGGAATADSITIFDVNQEKTAMLHDTLSVNTAVTVEGMAAVSDVILLAVKPNVIESILDQHRTAFESKGIISIVTGWNQKRLSEQLPAETRLLCVMPNTPAMVGEGMIVFEKGNTLTDAEEAFAERLFHAVGKVTTVDGKQMNAVIGVSGSGPAYGYLFIEALADAGVKHGLSRAAAYELAAQTVLGAAKMVLESGEHPGVLKDRVCSPGGTTIEAVASLERSGFRGAVIDAVDACCAKAEAMQRSDS